MSDVGGRASHKAVPVAFLFRQPRPPLSAWAGVAEQVSCLGCKGAPAPLWSSYSRCQQGRAWRFQKQRGLSGRASLWDSTSTVPVLWPFHSGHPPRCGSLSQLGGSEGPRGSSFCFLSQGLVDLLTAAATRSNFCPFVQNNERAATGKWGAGFQQEAHWAAKEQIQPEYVGIWALSKCFIFKQKGMGNVSSFFPSFKIERHPSSKIEFQSHIKYLINKRWKYTVTLGISFDSWKPRNFEVVLGRLIAGIIDSLFLNTGISSSIL